MSLAFPPAGAWPIAFVSMVPLLWVIQGLRPRHAFVVGLVFGLGFFGATLYWIWRFGEMAYLSLTLLMALWIGVFGAGYAVLRRPGHPLASAFAAAALWTVLEWGRSSWPLGGFSWAGLGIGQVDNTVLLRLASISGVWGITFVVVAVNALLLVVIEGGTAIRRRIAAGGLAVTLVLAPAAVAFPRALGDELDVAAIQVDVREAERGSARVEDRAVARLNIEAHAGLADDPPDLISWGEGALDPSAAADPEVVAAVQAVIAGVGVPTLVGAVTDDADGAQRTNVLLFDGMGALVDRYDKTHLVPFGEYVPFRRRLSWIGALEQIPVDRAPGEEPHALSLLEVGTFGAPICFENGFPQIPRSMVNDGAEYLIVTVNNASYGFTAASAQHGQMSRMRAVETGRWVVNAAVSGVSMFIDPSGHVVDESELFEPTVLRNTIRTSQTRTWYVRLGDWVPWAALVFLAAFFLLPRRREPAPRRPAALGPSHSTLVVLPTYDEAATIQQVIGGVLAAEGTSIVVVDDSSPDGTGDLVSKIAQEDPRVRLIRRPAKAGLASAYLEGFRMGLSEGADLIVEMDSDLSHDPEELPSLLHATASGHDLVVGSRYVTGGSVSDWSRTRVALSRAGNRYARTMLGLPIHDATSGFRVYRRNLLADLVARPFRSDGYGFQIELAMRAVDMGYDVAEAPITFRDRIHGHSKISRGIVVEALWLVTLWGLRKRLRWQRPDPAVPR